MNDEVMIENESGRIFRYNVVFTLAVIMLMSIIQIAETIPTSDRLAHNETFTFDFYVQNVIDMFSWQIKFEFDPKELEFIKFTTGENGYFLYDFSSKYGHPTVKVCTRKYMLACECILGWIGVQASGSGKLCSLTFRKLVVTHDLTITLLEDTFYITVGGSHLQTLTAKPLPIFMNISEP